MLHMRDTGAGRPEPAGYDAEEPASSPPPPVWPRPTDGLPLPRRLWAIVAVSFGTALFVIDGTIANVALPTIAGDLHIAAGSVVDVVTVYQLVTVMVLLPMSNLGDRIGLRRVYQIGQVIFLVASAMALFVHSLPALLAIRACQALGAGMGLSVASAQIRRIYPAGKLGSGLGINSVIVASSNALAPALGGFLVAHSDWRTIFVAGVPFAAASLLLGRFLPESAPTAKRFDWRAGLWSAGGMAMLVGGVELGSRGGLLHAGIALFVAGLFAMALLARREWRQPAPLLPVDLMARPETGLSVLAAVAAFMASASLLVALPFRLEQVMGYSPDQVGLLTMPFPLTMLVVAPLAGWLSDRVSPSLLGCIGMAVAAFGFAMLMTMPPVASAFAIGWRLVLTASGFAMFLSPNARLIVGSAPVSRAAAAGGLLATGRLFGQTLGAALIGALLSLGLGGGATPLAIAMGLCLAAGTGSWVRGRALRA